MPVCQVKLLGSAVIAADTMAFRVEKPTGFNYKPGQFADFTLADPPETDAEGNIRGFSLASAPYEDHLMFATRMRDTAFKRVLKALPLGSELTLDAPYGSFTLHHNQSVPAVFLTGGIGVTPVRSIVLQATHDHANHKITLFDCNRRPEEAVFFDELTDAQHKNPNYKFIGVMTRADKSRWPGDTGHLTAEMLRKYVSDLAAPIFYVAGPRGMVGAMRKILTECNVEEDNNRTEEFSGY
jgi:ferredoxin-NADP reductase